MKVGSEEQRKLHLQRIARGEVKWAQGFSEPGAGSDLASMTTRAELQGDVFIVNGQKIWSSGAHKADYLLLMCRTDPDVPKHKGISALMVDLKNTKQGLDIRPILNMNNQGGFNECFFDNMEVPRENLLGEINQGWYYAMGLLESERSSFINFSAVGRSVLDGLTALVLDKKALGVASAKRPEIRSRLADAAIELSVGRNLAYHVSWMSSKGISPDYQASVAKVFNTETFKRVAVTAMQIIGLYGQLQDPRVAPLMGRINSIYYTSIGMTIAGGTSEIQRNVIATRGLGLPR
ncbi:MAG: acyl-CoA dehydrogenase family protein, partial [Chloroflexi bacterium]|nr:acyl-CoA dehydrogenase family protein [Chloroflexota bacterium]